MWKSKHRDNLPGDTGFKMETTIWQDGRVAEKDSLSTSVLVSHLHRTIQLMICPGLEAILSPETLLKQTISQKPKQQ